MSGSTRSVAARLLDAYPAAYALEYANESYAEVATALSEALGEIEYGKHRDSAVLASLWTAVNDTRSLMVVGDPAVLLAM